MVDSRPLVRFNQTNDKFVQQIIVNNVHLVPAAGIQTH